VAKLRNINVPIADPQSRSGQQQLFTARHGITIRPPGRGQIFTVRNQQEIARRPPLPPRVNDAFAGGNAGVSLVVGGLAI